MTVHVGVLVGSSHVVLCTPRRPVEGQVNAWTKLAYNFLHSLGYQPLRAEEGAGTPDYFLQVCFFPAPCNRAQFIINFNMGAGVVGDI